MFNKTNNIILLVVLVFLLILDIYYVVISHQVSNEVITSSGVANYKARFVDLLNNDGIDLSTVEIEDIDSGDYHSVDDIIHKSSDSIIIVCRFSQYSCNQCVMYAINKCISECKGQNVRLLFWGQYVSVNGMKIIRSELGLEEYECYNVPARILPIDDKVEPYYFILSNKNIVSHIFIPKVYETTASDDYWSSLLRQ